MASEWEAVAPAGPGEAREGAAAPAGSPAPPPPPADAPAPPWWPPKGRAWEVVAPAASPPPAWAGGGAFEAAGGPWSPPPWEVERGYNRRDWDAPPPWQGGYQAGFQAGFREGLRAASAGYGPAAGSPWRDRSPGEGYAAYRPGGSPYRGAGYSEEEAWWDSYRRYDAGWYGGWEGANGHGGSAWRDGAWGDNYYNYGGGWEGANRHAAGPDPQGREASFDAGAGAAPPAVTPGEVVFQAGELLGAAEDDGEGEGEGAAQWELTDEWKARFERTEQKRRQRKQRAAKPPAARGEPNVDESLLVRDFEAAQLSELAARMAALRDAKADIYGDDGAAAVEEAEDALDAAFDEQNGAVQPPVWPAEL